MQHLTDIGVFWRREVILYVLTGLHCLWGKNMWVHPTGSLRHAAEACVNSFPTKQRDDCCNALWIMLTWPHLYLHMYLCHFQYPVRTPLIQCSPHTATLVHYGCILTYAQTGQPWFWGIKNNSFQCQDSGHPTNQKAFGLKRHSWTQTLKS